MGSRRGRGQESLGDGGISSGNGDIIIRSIYIYI